MVSYVRDSLIWGIHINYITFLCHIQYFPKILGIKERFPFKYV